MYRHGGGEGRGQEHGTGEGRSQGHGEGEEEVDFVAGEMEGLGRELRGPEEEVITLVVQGEQILAVRESLATTSNFFRVSKFYPVHISHVSTLFHVQTSYALQLVLSFISIPKQILDLNVKN